MLLDREEPIVRLTENTPDNIEKMDEEIKGAREMLLVQEACIMAMSVLAETRDHDTGFHLWRSKRYIRTLAEHMAGMDKFKNILTPDVIEAIVLSAPLHDIGKVGTPDYILLKPGVLTEEEYNIMKKHTILGRDAIVQVERLIGYGDTFLQYAKEISYSHHEKWDGSGYPEGISGEDIPLAARMIAIVDAYDALTSGRVYRAAVSHEEAVSIIEKDIGRHFDPYIGRAFLEVQDRFYSILEKYADSYESELI